MSVQTLYSAYPEVDWLVDRLRDEICALLGSRLTGLYLDGSLANGGFDAASDIDFVALTTGKVDEMTFSALHAMHARIAALDSPWAIEIEGSYVPAAAARRHDPACTLHPNLERGAGERLKWAEHGADWDVHRHILRERGIPLFGPPPASLIDPVPVASLRQAARAALNEWSSRVIPRPEIINSAGYQSYFVLSVCRVLYTLYVGEIASKQAAMHWAVASLDPRWRALIDRAWVDRSTPTPQVDPALREQTLAFIRHGLDLATQLA